MSTTGIAQRDCKRALCISTPQSEIVKRNPWEGYGSACANGLPSALSQGEVADDEPDERHEQPGRASMAEDDRGEKKRQEGIWKSPRPPPRYGGAPTRV